MITEIPGIFASMAEASVTLAGFSAVFRAFGSTNYPDGLSAQDLSRLKSRPIVQRQGSF